MTIGDLSRRMFAVCVPSAFTARSQSRPKRLTEEDEWRDAYHLTAAVHSDKPTAGFVPDAQTAERIADAVASALYGEQQAGSERPYRARLGGNVWTVLGTHHPPLALGGNSILQTSKIDGRIIFVHHTEYLDSRPSRVSQHGLRRTLTVIRGSATLMLGGMSSIQGRRSADEPVVSETFS
jgi:hypothetical protein